MPDNEKSQGDRVVKSACRGCHGVCGALVHMRDGKVTKVTGDPECPTNLGYICPKGTASVELLYHPDRLKYPMKRVGKRGENRWQRITWDEALDTVAGKLMGYKKEFGAESVATVVGTGRPQVSLLMRFSNCFGTPNHLSIVNNCYVPRILASHMTSGKFPICDYYGFGGETPKLIMVWGCNVVGAGGVDGMCGYQITRTVNNGAKMIVIDPRRTGLAERADLWLQIRPGTDDALVLGMLNVIVKEKLYDKEFVEKWTTGFDELAARAADFTPERVAQITWIPAEKIVAAARLYATTRPACMQWGNGLDQHTNGFQTSRTIHCLSAITGNLDISGGDVAWVPPEGVKTFGGHGNFDLTMRDRITPEIKAKMLGVGKYKVMDGATMHPRALLDAIMTGQPYPVKALFVMGSNTLLNQTDSIRTAEAFKKVDFTVVTDMFMTPTAQLADIVLPASSWLENDEVADTHMGWCVLIRQKVAEIGECRDDKQILFDLAHRMGMNDDFPWKDVREFCNWTLEDTDIDFEEFKKIGILAGKMRYRKYEQDGFDTPSGKVELRCSTLEKMGYDPLISYVEPPESPVSTPELYREYPLIVTTGGRILGYFCSEGRQIPSLRKLNPDPLVDIHPETARSLGIKNGDWVWIESRRGRIRQRARVTDGIDPRVVHVQHGWWFPEKGPPDYGFTESNANILTGNMPCDPHTGSESMRAFLGKVYKV